MSWFKVDDGFHDHRKARQAGVEAVGLWLLAGTWAAGALTDGFVPAPILPRWHPKPNRLAQRLVDVGLWSEDEQDGERGYRFHDWKVYQPTRAEVEELRTKRAEVGRRGGVASGQQRRSNPPSKPEAKCSAEPEQDSSKPEANDEAKTNPVPARPGPTPSAPTVLPATTPATADLATVNQRAKRLTDNYAATEPMCKWPAVNAIVIKAIKADRYTDDLIGSALQRLASEGRGVTVETLRTELDGLPPSRAPNGHRPSTTDQRVAAGLELAAKYRALEDEEHEAERDKRLAIASSGLRPADHRPV